MQHQSLQFSEFPQKRFQSVNTCAILVYTRGHPIDDGAFAHTQTLTTFAALVRTVASVSTFAYGIVNPDAPICTSHAYPARWVGLACARYSAGQIHWPAFCIGGWLSCDEN